MCQLPPEAGNPWYVYVYNNRCVSDKIYVCVYIYIYIYMRAVVLLSGPSLVFEVLLSGPSLFFTKHCLSKTL